MAWKLVLAAVIYFMTGDVEEFSCITRIRPTGDLFTQVWEIETRDGNDWSWEMLYHHVRLCSDDKDFYDERLPCKPMTDLKIYALIQNSAEGCCEAGEK